MTTKTDITKKDAGDVIRFTPLDLTSPLQNPASDYTRLKSITYTAKRQMGIIYDLWLKSKPDEQQFSAYLKTIGL